MLVSLIYGRYQRYLLLKRQVPLSLPLLRRLQVGSVFNEHKVKLMSHMNYKDGASGRNGHPVQSHADPVLERTRENTQQLE